MASTMIHPDEALRLVTEAGDAAWRARGPSDRTEEAPLADARGRALPEALPSTMDHPPFDKSAMDGFAWSGPAGPGGTAGVDGPVFRVRESVAAGAVPRGALGPGEAARIMTGAPLPEGAAAVQRVEWTDGAGTAPDGSPLVRFTKPEPTSNVILRGENLRRGETLLGPRMLGPQDIGILASSGYGFVRVARRPVVGVLSTGDELCAPGTEAGPASIYDSNGPQLAAQAASAGCEVRRCGIVRDTADGIAAALSRALDECDVVLVSGGVSMGDFDHVPSALERLGVCRVFHKVAMRPGKPAWFGVRDGKAVFGLPGNPVSTFVNFEVLVKPHLMARMGIPWQPRVVRAGLSAPLSRRETDRVDFLPAVLRPAGGGMAAEPLRYGGSSMLSVLAHADCLLRMEIGVERMEEGEAVDARLIRP